MPAVTNGLQCNGVDVVRHEAAVGAGSMSQGLAQHAPDHRLQSGVVTVVVVPHALYGAAYADLASGNVDCGVEEIEIGQLAIDTVVNNVQLLETMAPRTGRVVNGNSSLQSSSLDVE